MVVQTPQVAASHVGLQVDHHNGSHTAGHDDLLPCLIISSPHLHKPMISLSQDNTRVTLFLLPITPNALAKSCCKRIMLSHTLLQGITFWPSAPLVAPESYWKSMTDQSGLTRRLEEAEHELLPQESQASQNCTGRCAQGGGGVHTHRSYPYTIQNKSSITIIS